MRIFNKFVESKKAPQNYQDIWFDGSVVRLYKQGSWEEVSLPIEDLKMLQSFVSTAEVFQIVTELPEEGLADYIYVLLNVVTQNPSIKLYTFVDSAWEEIGGMASSSLLKLSDCLIPFIPKKQSIITTEDFKEIVEKYDLVNKKGISLACLYKTNNKNYSFGILTFSENNEYQRVDILSNHPFNDFKTDEKLYNPFNSYENTAWLYNTQYNILTPLGTYTSPEYSPIKDESVTKAKLSKEVQEMLENPTGGPSGEYITPDWNALEGEPGYIENKPNLDVPFEKGDADNSAVLKGGNNKTTNVNEVAIGRYNKSNNGTQFSIGTGTPDTDRKNAYEIMQDGKHYIYGIGDYDGTNAVTPNANGIIAKSVQEVINDNFGGIIIVEHSDTLSKNYVIDVYNKISYAILSGKIYTIYVDNKTDKTIYGNIQVSAIGSNNVHLSHTIMYPDGNVYIHRHTYHANGQYEFVKGTYNLKKISELETKLNEITTND